MTDWNAIEQDRAAGMSLRTLEAKYDIRKSTLAYRFNKPFREASLDNAHSDIGQIGQPCTAPPTDIVALVKRLIEQLSRISKDELDLKEHNLLAQALSQYFKIMVAAPAQEQSAGQQQFDLSILTEEELEQVQSIFAQAEARLNITPIRNAS